MKDYTHDYLLTWGIPNLDNYIKYKTMTPEKKEMLVTILTSIRAILNTVLKNGIFKTITDYLIEVAIEIIKDQENVEQKGREYLPKNQGT